MTDLYTNGRAVDILEQEGVDYAIRHYCSGESFKDPETVRLWNEASKALDALIKYLEDETGREVEA